MTKIVDTYARKQALEAARQVVKHQGNRVWDEVVALDEVIDRGDPLAVIAAIHKISGLLGGMKTNVHVWGGLKVDLANNPDASVPVEAPVLEPRSLAAENEPEKTDDDIMPF
jgi:hypothetical protein